MNDMIDVTHSKTNQTAKVSVRSFELVWSLKGWRPARTAKKQSKTAAKADNPTPKE